MFVPEAERPREVTKALEAFRQRVADLAEAEAALRSATAAIDEAKAQDRLALAEALDRSEDDPGRAHEERARALADDAQRVVEAQKLRHESAKDALMRALHDAAPEWSGSLMGATEAAEVESLRALEVFEEAEQRREGLRGAQAWLDQFIRFGQTPKRAPATGQVRSTLRINASNPECHSIAALVVAIREGVERTTLRGQAEREAERERKEAEAQERQAQVRAAREAFGR